MSSPPRKKTRTQASGPCYTAPDVFYELEKDFKQQGKNKQKGERQRKKGEGESVSTLYLSHYVLMEIRCDEQARK